MASTKSAPAKKAAVKKSPPKKTATTTAAKKAPAKTAGKGARGVKSASDNGRIAQLETELEAANARIADLEARQTDVLNRIEWILEGLQGLLEAAERAPRRKSA